MKQLRESKSPSAQVRLPVTLSDRMNAIKPMARRVAWVEAAFEVVPLPPAEDNETEDARALFAPAEPVGVTPVAGVEPEVTVALPEPGELVPGSPGAGSPVVVPKTVRSIDRSGFGGPAEEWVGAVVHLPDDCLWFLSLDDASRADAVRRALSRCREVAVEREERLTGMSLPEGLERPSHIPNSWDPVTVWVPARIAVWPVQIQALVNRQLHIEKQRGSFDLEAFIAEKKEKAKKPEGTQ